MMDSLRQVLHRARAWFPNSKLDHELDPATFVGMILVPSGVAFVAGYIPARRAWRIHPMIALRSN